MYMAYVRFQFLKNATGNMDRENQRDHIFNVICVCVCELVYICIFPNVLVLFLKDILCPDFLGYKWLDAFFFFTTTQKRQPVKVLMYQIAF